MRKNSFIHNEWRRAANFIGRKRDTLYYTAVLGVGGYLTQKYGFDFNKTVWICLAAPGREFVRAINWWRAKNDAYGDASMMAASGLYLMTVPLQAAATAQLNLAGAVFIAVSPLTAQFLNNYLQSRRDTGLSAGDLFKLYRDVLFDYENKKGPPRPPQESSHFITRLLGKLIPPPHPRPV